MFVDFWIDFRRLFLRDARLPVDFGVDAIMDTGVVSDDKFSLFTEETADLSTDLRPLVVAEDLLGEGVDLFTYAVVSSFTTVLVTVVFLDVDFFEDLGRLADFWTFDLLSPRDFLRGVVTCPSTPSSCSKPATDSESCDLFLLAVLVDLEADFECVADFAPLLEEILSELDAEFTILDLPDFGDFFADFFGETAWLGLGLRVLTGDSSPIF